eukprot:1108833-Amphidinium_carterae.1
MHQVEDEPVQNLDAGAEENEDADEDDFKDPVQTAAQPSRHVVRPSQMRPGRGKNSGGLGVEAKS